MTFLILFYRKTPLFEGFVIFKINRFYFFRYKPIIIKANAKKSPTNHLSKSDLVCSIFKSKNEVMLKKCPNCGCEI